MLKKRLLLHICCASCGVYVTELLKQDFDVTLFYYNPNIFPKAEHIKRLKWVELISKNLDVEVIYGEYNHIKWLKEIAGYEKEPEAGTRCFVCYQDRLRATAQRASVDKFDIFTTTLTISPHKISSWIIDIGKGFGEKFQVDFLAQDFKKKDGFKKSVEVSNKLGCYRQNYCGCEFSYRSE